MRPTPRPSRGSMNKTIACHTLDLIDRAWRSITRGRRAMRMSARPLALAVAMAGAVATAGAHAQSRLVVVNGVRLSDRQIEQLEHFNCAQIPNGWYWLNLANGAWGYIGNWNVQGYFGQYCNAAGNHEARQRRQSLSERGLLYTPSEILSGR